MEFAVSDWFSTDSLFHCVEILLQLGVLCCQFHLGTVQSTVNPALFYQFLKYLAVDEHNIAGNYDLDKC
jgi:hypothetical protein